MTVASRALQTLALLVLTLGLGVASLVWNLIALALYPVMARESGLALGRRAISRVYRVFWRACRAVGLLEMDAVAVDAPRDERGLRLRHPRLHERAFALAALAGLDPSLVVPGHGPVLQLLARLESSP